MVPYEDCHVTGPHKHTNFYFVMEITKPNGSRTSVVYHRYLMELHLGRYLDKREYVHHIDGRVTNNELSNLQVMLDIDHGFLHHGKPPESYVCPTCRKTFTLKGRKLSSRKQGVLTGSANTGPYCSKSCANSFTGRNPPQEFTCACCSTSFELEGRKLSLFLYALKEKKKPFCSKLCFRKYKKETIDGIL